MWDECSCAVVWTFFGLAFLWDWNENWPFQSWSHCWVFQICWHIECSTFTASSFRILNSSTGIPSPPLALLHIPGCVALGKWSHRCGYLGHEDLFLYSSSVFCCHLFLISSASTSSLPFLSFIVGTVIDTRYYHAWWVVWGTFSYTHWPSLSLEKCLFNPQPIF